MKKTLNPYSRKNPCPPYPGFKFTQKSLVIPCLSLTVRDILMRTANGEIVPDFKKTYDDDHDMKHTVNIYVKDLTEIDKNKRSVSKLEKQLQEEQQQQQDELNKQRDEQTKTNDATTTT
jgi:predicted ribosome quality control (RQC) complex YloA/Tae2 family protein